MEEYIINKSDYVDLKKIASQLKTYKQLNQEILEQLNGIINRIIPQKTNAGTVNSIESSSRIRLVYDYDINQNLENVRSRNKYARTALVEIRKELIKGNMIGIIDTQKGNPVKILKVAKHGKKR